jgi:hypothetical protein
MHQKIFHAGKLNRDRLIVLPTQSCIPRVKDNRRCVVIPMQRRLLEIANRL